MNYPTVYSYEPAYPINLIGNTGGAVQISIHAPSPYICANRERILPDWQNHLCLWMVIVLQQSRYQLVESTKEIETEKQQLREKFMRFGVDVAFHLRDRGYLTDLIDPRTGYPLLSRPGEIPHDDTAVVKALLHYPIICNQCRVLVHPRWGMAVYPSVLISVAHPAIIDSVIKTIAPLHGWKQIH
ncbi:MAG: methylmalonic aciduria and homocystinuria type D protein [Nostocaceae cyanobacterium]|nr:methylmalonic aciduria and homocystinuria type D protein [Nostocaceae cyanobacterium]